MSQTTTVIITVLLCSIGFVVVETRKHRDRDAVEKPVEVTPTRLVGQTVRAPGRISGMSEDIELHAQLVEPVEQIHVKEGQFVSQGTTLITLKKSSLLLEHDLAAAVVEEMQATLDRLMHGARESELATARLEHDAAKSQLDAAESRWRRSVKLFAANAMSSQDLEDVKFNSLTLKALAQASENRLRTLAQPPRTEDVIAAESAVRAATAKLALVDDRLNRASILAPVDGFVLKIAAQVGEMPGKGGNLPIVIMCKSRRQRAIIEVDEFDALRVSIGQSCEITTDGLDGVIARGSVSEIEPRMEQKRIYGQWAGERSDTFSLRAWVDLDEETSRLPIGLPIRAQLQL